MIATNMTRQLMSAHRIHPNTTTHQCDRCGITITWDRHHYYGPICRDCTHYIPVTRKKRAA